MKVKSLQSHIDKKTDDKYDISNFRPVSLLKCFLQVCENTIKWGLVDSIYKNISSFTIPNIITLRYNAQNYDSQHVMLRVLDKWRENLDKNYCDWKGNNGPIQSFWLCSSWSFTCKNYRIWCRWKLRMTLLCYMYSHPLNWKQSVRINNINNNFLNAITGVS